MYSYTQEIDLTKPDYVNFISDIVTSNFLLPDMSGLRIKNIGISPETVNKFFANWFPDELSWLSVNENPKNKELIKMEDYIESLLWALDKVTSSVLLFRSALFHKLK